jgi:signal transduction histidine kinase
MQKIRQMTALHHAWQKWTLVVGLFVMYAVIFQPLLKPVGPVISAMVVIPVIAAAWYLGIRVGLVAGIIGITLNASLLSLFVGGKSWVEWLTQYWPSNFMVLVASYVVGLLQRVLTERTNINVELHSRERFISLMGLAVRDILDPKIHDDTHFSLANHLANLFVADYAYITTWNAAQGKMTLLISTKPLEKPFLNIVLDPDKVTANSFLLKNRQILVMSAGAKLPYSVDITNLTELSLPGTSELAVPLIAGDYKFGVVMLRFDSARIFSHEDVAYAQLMASQIALAFWTSEQDLRIQRQSKQALALAKIERTLSETEKVGIETVLQLIVNSAKELIPDAEYAVLHMLDDENENLVARAVAGLEERPRTALNLPMSGSVAGQVIATRNVIVVADAQTDPRFLNRTPPVTYRSLVVGPIGGHQQVFGTISVYSDPPNLFTLESSDLLSALGIQAAIAIENANLLETTRQDLKEMNILYQISRDLAISLDPDQLMINLVHILEQSFGFYYTQIFVIDPQSGDLLATHGSGAAAIQYQQQGHHIALGEGIVGHVAEIGEPFMTNNVDNVVFYVRDATLPDTQSELAAAIKAGNQILGVLDIQERLPNRFTPRQLKLMNAIAEQLAVALQKAKLYSELQASLRQEKATYTQLIQVERLAVAGRLLASVAHELNNPLQVIQNALFLLKGDEKLSDQGQQDLEIIVSETERMASLISRLRTTYRVNPSEDYREVDLNDLIEDIGALTTTHMRHKNIAFEFHPEPQLPHIPAISDQIKQVTLNLFMNAIEAMETGGSFIVQTQCLTDQDQVMISFSDTGPGISSDIFPRIFEPFVTNKGSGTGLGLAITYDIIRQHQGSIQAENNPRGGATFKVWLPIHRKN